MLSQGAPEPRGPSLELAGCQVEDHSQRAPVRGHLVQRQTRLKGQLHSQTQMATNESWFERAWFHLKLHSSVGQLALKVQGLSRGGRSYKVMKQLGPWVIYQLLSLCATRTWRWVRTIRYHRKQALTLLSIQSQGIRAASL